MLGISLVTATARELSGMTDAAMPSAVVSGAWAISLLAVATLALSAALWWIRDAATRAQGVRREITWGCGYDAPTPRMQYTASSFASPLLAVFGRLSGVRVDRTAASLHTHPADLVLDGVALPLWHAIHGASLRLRAMQQGRLHFYLLYVLAALLVLLAYLALGSSR
jgi:hypothetical protein